MHGQIKPLPFGRLPVRVRSKVLNYSTMKETFKFWVGMSFVSTFALIAWIILSMPIFAAGTLFIFAVSISQTIYIGSKIK